MLDFGEMFFWRVDMTLTQDVIEFLAHYIVESDAIEHITRSYDEVLAQLSSGYTDGHVGAYIHLLTALENGELISEGLIREVQALIVTEQTAYGQRALHEKHIGAWRTIGVTVGGRDCPSPLFVPESMERFVRRVHSWQKHRFARMSPLDNMRFVAKSHFEYLDIHPFADGNGRSSRAIVYFLYRHARLHPFIFTSRDRYDTYYQCFNDKNDANDMVAYFRMRTPLPATP